MLLQTMQQPIINSFTVSTGAILKHFLLTFVKTCLLTLHTDEILKFKTLLGIFKRNNFCKKGKRRTHQSLDMTLVFAINTKSKQLKLSIIEMCYTISGQGRIHTSSFCTVYTEHLLSMKMQNI